MAMNQCAGMGVERQGAQGALRGFLALVNLARSFSALYYEEQF